MKNETRRNQFKFKFLGNNTIILLVTICLNFCIIGSMHTIFNNEIVYAEESETLTTQQILNFNQLVSNNYNVSVGYGWLCQGIPQNHIIYIKYDITTNANTDMYNNANIREFRVGNYKEDFLYTTPVDNSGLGLYSSQNIKINYFNVIDLTLMYGENTPTIEECRHIFTSDYYNYTTGTAIISDNLESYTRGYTAGFNSAWESQNVSYKQYVIGAQSFAFNNQQYTEESTKSYDAIAGAYSFSGILGIPLGFLSVGGTNYEIDFTLLCTDWAGESLSFKQEYSLYFYYVNSDNNLIQIGKIPYFEISGNYGTYKGSFVCPVDTDTIYLEFTTEPLDNTPTIATAFASNITFRSQNIESAINSAFNSGAESVKDSYLPGGDLYNEIYNLGYSNGSASNKPFTDSWDFIGQSFHGIGEILAMELIPGLPLGLFVALPLLVGLLFFIVKIAKGSGG